jgi:hypothetical protein
MIKFLRQFNSRLNLFQSLVKKIKSATEFLKQKKLLTAAIVIVVLAAISLVVGGRTASFKLLSLFGRLFWLLSSLL